MPDIFKYSDHRTFLKDYYTENKRKNPYFSYRSLNQKMGFSSPSHLRDVIIGKTNLGYKSLQKMIQAFSFKKKEAEYFESVVFFNQEKSLEEKKKHLQKIRSLKIKNKSKILSELEESVLSDWINVLLMEMVTLVDFNEDPTFLMKKIKPKISEKRIKEGLEKLKKLGLLSKINGKLQKTNQAIATADEIKNLLVQEFHKHMVQEALNALDESVHEREFFSATVALSQDDFQKLKEKIKEFRDSSITPSERPQKVYQLNIQLFPLTK